MQAGAVMRFAVAFGALVWVFGLAAALSLLLLAVPVVLVPVGLARLARDWRGGYEVRVRRMWRWR